MKAKGKKSGKLFSLMEWLSLEDAAKYLSTIFDEEVTVPDVLRLALDRRLTLSVWFVNHAPARKGKLVPFSECEMTLFPSLGAGKLNVQLPEKRAFTHEELKALYPTIKEHVDVGDLIIAPKAIHFSDNDQWLVQERQVTMISGIWDLPMRGCERLDLEHRFLMETGGPAVTLTDLDGTFVERDGVVCQLQEEFDKNEFHPGSTANLKSLKERIEREGVAKEQADVLLRQHSEAREQFRKRRRRYYPAGGLPEDAVWVVRTAALREFERNFAEGEPGKEEALSRREETTLLNIAGGLLGLLLGKTPSGKAQSVFKDQTAVIEALLASYPGKPGIAKRTLEAKLPEAKRSLSSS